MSVPEPLIITSQDRLSGTPAFDILDLLAAGESRKQILEDFPDLEPEDITASLLYAARRLDHPTIAA